jgi:hypothetical protein
MKKETIKLLIAIIISLGIGFMGGMYVNAYQNSDPTFSDVLEYVLEEDWNESRVKASEASERVEKQNLLIDIILFEDDLGTFRYDWDTEDLEDFSVEYMERVKQELETELSIKNNQ